jgi:haloacetate dehalogenase
MDKADRKAAHKVGCPLLVLWGAKSHTGTVYGDVLAVWQDYATEVTGGPIECGHYVPEEAPDETLRWLLRHFGEG